MSVEMSLFHKRNGYLLSVNQSLRKREKVFAAIRSQGSEKCSPNYPVVNLRNAKNTYLEWKKYSKRWTKFVTSNKQSLRSRFLKPCSLLLKNLQNNRTNFADTLLRCLIRDNHGNTIDPSLNFLVNLTMSQQCYYMLEI